MKKLFQILLISTVLLIISSCENKSDNPVDSSQTDKGSLYITSNPAGAQIWLDNSNTGQVTPDTVKNIQEGTHNITLKLTEYRDTTISVSVTAGQTKNVSNVVLSSSVTTMLFGPVQIYESQDSTSSYLHGIDLSTGKAWSVYSDSSGLIDIYYSTEGTGGRGYLVQSADLKIDLINVTKFYLGSGNNIYDDVDSPDRNDNGWVNYMSDSPDSNYVFLYDHDGHYSKLKIVSAGGGVPGEPKWVRVQWYYNKVLLDKRF